MFKSIAGSAGIQGFKQVINLQFLRPRWRRFPFLIHPTVPGSNYPYAFQSLKLKKICFSDNSCNSPEIRVFCTNLQPYYWGLGGWVMLRDQALWVEWLHWIFILFHLKCAESLEIKPLGHTKTGLFLTSEPSLGLLYTFWDWGHALVFIFKIDLLSMTEAEKKNYRGQPASAASERKAMELILQVHKNVMPWRQLPLELCEGIKVPRSQWGLWNMTGDSAPS